MTSRVTHLPVDLSFLSSHTTGWSPEGRRFAWEEPSRILLLEEDREVLTLPVPRNVPPGAWSAAWIDDRRLFLTITSNRTDRSMPWFLVMGIDGTTNFGPSLLLPSGTTLTAPALIWTPGSEAESLQRFDGEPVLVLQSGSRIPCYFCRLDLFAFG